MQLPLIPKTSLSVTIKLRPPQIKQLSPKAKKIIRPLKNSHKMHPSPK